MTTQPTNQERLTEVLNVMLLHITHLNVTAIGLEGKRKEIALEDSINTTELAEWFKENYIDVTETTAKIGDKLVDDYHTRVLALIENVKDNVKRLGGIPGRTAELEHQENKALLAKIKDSCRKIEQQLLYWVN